MTSQVQKSKIKISIDINFSQARHIIDLNRYIPLIKREWQFMFGVSAGELACELRNLESPIDLRNFHVLLPRSKMIQRTETERKVGTMSELDSSKAGVELSLKPNVSSGSEASATEETTSESIDGTSYAVPQVRVQEKGDEKAPKWGFQALTLRDVLIGRINEHLAEFSILSVQAPCSLIGRFKVSLPAIKVTEIDGGKFPELSKKRQEFIRMRLRRTLYESIADYLSKAEVHVGN